MPTGRVRGVHLAFADGSNGAISTDLLIGADGLRSAVARQLDVPVTRQGVLASAYVLQYFADVDLPASAYSLALPARARCRRDPHQRRQLLRVRRDAARSFQPEARHDAAATMAEVLRALDPDLSTGAEQRGTTAGPIRSWPGVRGQFRKPYGPGLGARGRRRLLQGPVRRPRHLGRVPGRRAVGRRNRSTVTSPRYERLRDELSMPLFAVLERIASYDWDLDSLPGLHVQLAQAMRDEEDRCSAPGARGRHAA